LSEVSFSFAAFTSAAFVTALPGIVLQLIAVPTIILAFKHEVGWRRRNA